MEEQDRKYFAEFKISGRKASAAVEKIEKALEDIRAAAFELERAGFFAITPAGEEAPPDGE